MVTNNGGLERFDGKVVVVTGAAGGLGKATACAFASAGADLAICDIDADGLAATAAEIAAAGGGRFSSARLILPIPLHVEALCTRLPRRCKA